MNDPSQPAAIITGAGRGIGAACAQTFAQAEWNVVLVDRDESELTAVAQACEGDPAILVGDVTLRATSDAAVALALGRVHPARLRRGERRRQPGAAD